VGAAVPNPEVGHADARARWTTAARSETPPVPTVPQELLVQPPIGATHSSSHRRKALQVFVLRETLQTVVPCTAAHKTTHW